MADEADMAQVKTDQLLNANIAACRSNLQGDSGREECIDCEEIIPSGRRKAVPGCERCIECQADFEGGR